VGFNIFWIFLSCFIICVYIQVEAANKGNNICTGSSWSIKTFLTYLKNNNDEQSYAHNEKYRYTSPNNLWIKEACSSTKKPCHFFDFFPRDEDFLTFLVQTTKEGLTDIHNRFNVSLFCLKTKHKGKTQGNDGFICQLHWLYGFT